jgi:hypothetical protein
MSDGNNANSIAGIESEDDAVRVFSEPAVPVAFIVQRILFRPFRNRREHSCELRFKPFRRFPTPSSIPLQRGFVVAFGKGID